MKLEVSRELFAYWNALRGERRAPERNDIEPGAIRGVLADTFVLEFDDPRGFPMRIAGSRTNALFLQELRGLSFLQIWRGDDRQEIKSILHNVAAEAQPYLLRAEARPPSLSPAEFEITLLPLRHHGSTHSRILGSIAVESQPQWLGLIGAGRVTLTSMRPLDLTAMQPAAPEALNGSSRPKPFALRKQLSAHSRDGRSS